MERDSQSSRHRFSWLAPSPLHLPLLSPFTWTFIRSSSFSFLLFPANSETTVRHRQLFQSPPLSAVVLFLALPSKIRDDSTAPSLAISVSSFSCLSFSCSSQQIQRRQYRTVSGYFSLLLFQLSLSFFFFCSPACDRRWDVCSNALVMRHTVFSLFPGLAEQSVHSPLTHTLSAAVISWLEPISRSSTSFPLR